MELVFRPLANVKFSRNDFFVIQQRSTKIKMKPFFLISFQRAACAAAVSEPLPASRSRCNTLLACRLKTHVGMVRVTSRLAECACKRKKKIVVFVPVGALDSGVDE